MTDICQFFRAPCPGCSNLLANLNVNYEAGRFFIVDQHDVRPIVKQMLVSLDGKVPEDLGVVLPDYFFLVLPTSLYCAQEYSAHMALYTIEATLLCLSMYSVPASLLQLLVICPAVSACCLHNLNLESCTVW